MDDCNHCILIHNNQTDDCILIIIKQNKKVLHTHLYCAQWQRVVWLQFVCRESFRIYKIYIGLDKSEFEKTEDIK